MTGPGAVAKELRVSPSTIRNYTRELSDQLSEGANPQAGERRDYTAEDIEVLRAALQLKAEGLSFDEISEEIEKGTYRIVEEEPEEEDIPGPRPGPVPGAMIPIEQLRAWASPFLEERDRLLEEREGLQERVYSLEREIGRLQGRLEVLEEGEQAEASPWWRRILRRG